MRSLDTMRVTLFLSCSSENPPEGELEAVNVPFLCHTLQDLTYTLIPPDNLRPILLCHALQNLISYTHFLDPEPRLYSLTINTPGSVNLLAWPQRKKGRMRVKTL